MPSPIKITRLFADSTGESHFEDIEIDMASVQYAPPAPAVDMSDPTATSQLYWFRFPEDWEDAAHPSPRRQIFVVLEGAVEGWTSKGETRVFEPGDRLLMEDTTGKGHGARPVDGEAVAMVIVLAQEN